MATRFDPIKTTESAVRHQEGTSLVVNFASLHAQGYALPLGVPFKTRPTAMCSEKATLEGTGQGVDLNRSPLTLRREDGTVYAFPIDPIMAVSSKNIITRRYVAKGSLHGTVKESWSQDDYELTVSGALISDTAENLNAAVQALREVCESGETLQVENDWLMDGFGITRVVIESYQFPHTKGLTNQSYTLKMYSDDSINILEEVQ